MRSLAAIVATLTMFLAVFAGVTVSQPKAADAAPLGDTSVMMGTGSAQAPLGGINISVTASPTSLPYGGGSVTYTYTVTNPSTGSQYNRTNWMFYSSVQSSTCGQLTPVKPLNYYSASGEYYLLPGQSATWTCTTTVRQDTTETFTASFYDYYWYAARATATERVTVAKATYTCDNLWYTSGYRTSYLGTISPTSPYSVSRKLNFQSLYDYFPSSTSLQQVYGSAAMAVDPTNPNVSYFIARDINDKYGGLWSYDASTGTARRITTHTSTPDTNRLGVDANGDLWALDIQGVIWRLPKGSTTWENRGTVTLGTQTDNPNTPGNESTLYTLVPGYSNSLASGDLAFDGLNNMWIIGSDQATGNAFLYTISNRDLLSTGATSATMVGNMGTGEFNGIAFDSTGHLYATTRYLNGTYANGAWQYGAFYSVDTSTGKATMLRYLTEMTEDIGSCALPKPELRIKKEATPPEGVLAGGLITYKVTIENIGNLEATGVTFKDDLAAQGLSYILGTTKLNGEPILDRNGVMQYTNTTYVKSSDTSLWGVVSAGQTATIEFQVRAGSTQTKVCNSGTANFTGNPTVNGILTDDPTLPGADDPTCTVILDPKIGVDKKGTDPTSGKPKTLVTSNNDPVTYTYAVSVDPNQPKGMATARVDGKLVEGPRPTTTFLLGNEDLKNVTITDDKCSPVTPVFREGSTTINTGDRNGDGILDTTETWQFTCTAQSITAKTTNTVTVNGVGVTSNKAVTDKDTWTVETTGFSVAKLAKVAGSATATWAPTGSAVDVHADGTTTATYRVTVTNVRDFVTTHPAIVDTMKPPTGFTVTSLTYAPVGANPAGTAGTPTTLTLNNGTYTIPAGTTPMATNESMTYEIVVKLKAADLSAVDWTAVGVCETTGTGDSTKGIFNTVSSSSDIDGPNNNDACVPVTPPMVTFSVTKLGQACDTDALTCELPGASFALYDTDPSVAGSTPIADGITVDAVNGAMFNSAELEVGQYWLVETAAPNGHILMAEPVVFELGFNGITITSTTTTNVTVDADNKFAMTVVDETPGTLPMAGGSGHALYIALGATLLVAGGVLYLRTSKLRPAQVKVRR